jgi:hypothetical protein
LNATSKQNEFLDVEAYHRLARLDTLSNQVNKALMYNDLRGIK